MNGTLYKWMNEYNKEDIRMGIVLDVGYDNVCLCYQPLTKYSQKLLNITFLHMHKSLFYKYGYTILFSPKKLIK